MTQLMRVEQADEPEGAVTSLTLKQQAFVREYVANGGNATQAATVAGYGHAESRGWELTRLPHVVQAIRVETGRRILAEGGAKGVRFMMGAVDDPKMAGAVRFQAAKWLAEAAGHGLAARAQDNGDGDGKPQSEMSMSELDEFIRAGSAAIAKVKAQRAEREAITGEVRELAHDDPAGHGAQPVIPASQG